MRYDSIAFRCLRFFAEHPGLHRAVTIVQLARAIDVEPGRAVYQRLRCDLIKADWKINKTGDHLYWMSAGEAKRAMVVVKKITAAHFRKQMREAA